MKSPLIPSSLVIRAVFRSSVEYGAQVFSFTRNQGLLLKIQRLQFRIIKAALGLRQFTPMCVLSETCEVLPSNSDLTFFQIYGSGTQDAAKLHHGGIRKQDSDWPPRWRFAASYMPEPLYIKVFLESLAWLSDPSVGYRLNLHLLLTPSAFTYLRTSLLSNHIFCKTYFGLYSPFYHFLPFYLYIGLAKKFIRFFRVEWNTMYISQN